MKLIKCRWLVSCMRISLHLLPLLAAAVYLNQLLWRERERANSRGRVWSTQHPTKNETMVDKMNWCAWTFASCNPCCCIGCHVTSSWDKTWTLAFVWHLSTLLQQRGSHSRPLLCSLLARLWSSRPLSRSRLFPMRRRQQQTEAGWQKCTHFKSMN